MEATICMLEEQWVDMADMYCERHKGLTWGDDGRIPFRD
jgi:hypothetical protein